MSTNAKEAKFRRQMDALDRHKAEMKKPADQRVAANLMPGREQIRHRNRCQLCCRGRAGYRKVALGERYSKRGGRGYQGYKEVRRVLDGLGIAIRSTSRGVMSDRQARKARVGGEILCTVW